MGHIFISYRRAESVHIVGRLYDHLMLAFGQENIFKDTENIKVGEIFTDVLVQAVNSCDVLLAVIGKQWLTISDEEGIPRITKGDDFVRLEVATALNRTNCTVIPVLIDNARMPGKNDLPESLRGFWQRNAMWLRNDPFFLDDVTRLISSLSELLNLEVNSAQSSSSNVDSLIARFFIARDKNNWDEARETLARLRNMENLLVKVDFDIQSHEERFRKDIEQHEKSRQYLELRDKIASGENHDIDGLIKMFEESHPNYDPEGIIRTSKELLERQKRKQITDTWMRKELEKTASEKLKITAPAVKQYSSIQQALSPLFSWVNIPAGTVELEGVYGSYIPFDTVREFNVPSFKIAKYPITNKQYQTFVNDGGYDTEYYWTKVGWSLRTLHQWSQPHHMGRTERIDQAPVVGISWYEAVAFTKWLSTVLKMPIQLPTEQQWQRSAQGNTNYNYPWGTKWISDNCHGTQQGVTAVTTYENNRSPFGVYDMVGNAWEWCLNDWETGNTDIEKKSKRRIVRGGAWDYVNFSFFRVTYRYAMYLPDKRHHNVGFRIATV